MYGIKIIYNRNDVVGMHLTTTINSKDQPVSILDAIVQMNALSFQKTEEGFLVTRLNSVK